MKKTIVALLFIIALNLKLSAQKIVTDRPDQTESSSTVPIKSLQIETGFLTGRTDQNNNMQRQLLIPNILFRYGLTRIIELRIADQLERLRTEQSPAENFGLSDLELGTKIQILRKEEINTEVAFLFHLIIPTGSVGLSNDKIGIVNKIAISHSFNDYLGLGYNLGYNYLGEGNGDLTYSFAIGLGISERSAIYAETYGEMTGLKDFMSNFDSGFTYLLQDNFQLDISLGFGLNNKMSYFSLGCSWNISRKHNN